MNDTWFMLIISKIKKVMSNQANLDGRFDELDANLTTLKSEIVGAGGGIKKVQRGVATAAGTITIEEVVMEKTVVFSVSKGSAGSVAVTGDLSIPAATGSASGSYTHAEGRNSSSSTGSPAIGTASATLSLSVKCPARTGTLSGGTTDLTVKEYSAVLTSSTTLECDGACEWQVVEYM